MNVARSIGLLSHVGATPREENPDGASELRVAGVANGWPSLSIFETRRVLRSLTEPKVLVALLGGMLLMLACNVNEVLGPHALGFKQHYTHWFMLFVIVATCWKAYSLPASIRISAASSVIRALPWFIAFCVLIGAHGLVSNGVDYQRMATDYWVGDPFYSTTRRIGLPALAHVLGFEQKFYTLFWYVLLLFGFVAARNLLVRRGLSSFEAFSVMSSSIFAYALVGPGYNEMFVFLLGLLALQLNLSLTEKIVVAALMLATHETATPFVAMALIVVSDERDRHEWVVVLGTLYLAFVASYAFNWQAEIGQAFLRAGKPDARAEDSSLSLAKRHPGLVIAGVFMAYKLYWLPVLTALRRRALILMSVATLASLVLAFVGSDTSRLVQFSSVALFLLVAAELHNWSERARKLLATANLVIPSLYIATNAGLLWGPGLYSFYFHVLSLTSYQPGRVFWQ